MIDLRPTIAPKSDQLNADDLIGQTKTIKITRVALCPEPDQPIAIHFEGDCGKPYKPGKSMRRVLVNVWGTDGNAFVGRKLTLFRDEKVKFGGHPVGGIRISHMSHIGDRDVVMALTMSKTNRAPYTVKPLHDESGAAGVATLADRVVAFKHAVLAAPTVEEKNALRKRAGKLFQDIDADQSVGGDFVTTSSGLDHWFQEQIHQALKNQGAPLARNDRIQASPEKPKRGRKSNAEKAEIAAREAAQQDPTAYTQPESVQASPELQSEPEEASEAEFTPVDASDPDAWMVLAEIDGPAPHGEEYTLLEDEPINGRLPVYLDGAKIGEIGPEDSGSYNAYDRHPESVEEFPGDKPAPVIGETVAANSGPVLTGAFKTFWANFIETEASSWQPIKDALRQLQATQDFKDLTPAEQNAWRRLVGQAIAAKIEAAEFEIDPLDDITAFRLALETWDEAEFVVEMWTSLQETALYKGLAENLQAALSKAVAERISALETA